MKRWLFLFLLVFTVITGGYFFWSWSLLPNGERFIYPIDDAYIHLAIAKNFALHGAWSVNPTGFDSASSSILYTLILSSLIKVFGNWEFYPLIINIICGYFTVYMIYRYFKDFYGVAELKWAWLLFLPFTLLYVMVLIGMEHTIHMALMVLAIYCIRQNVDSDFRGKDFVQLLVIVFFVSLVRFESMFFTAALGFALLLRRKFQQSILVLLTGFLPIVIFGLISVQNGGYFFPNSVLIKSEPSEGTSIIGAVFAILKERVFLNPSFYKCLFFPFVILAVFLFKKYRNQRIGELFRRETLIITVISMCGMHALFSVLKYRYENYLMISLLLLIIPVITEFLRNFKTKKIQFSFLNLSLAVSIAGIVIIALYRFQYMHTPSVVGSKNIYEQQVEMSRFLGEFYQGKKVVANDIGAISYFSNVQLLDMVGLGSTDVAKTLIENRSLPPEKFEAHYHDFLKNYIAKNDYRVAVIYPKWFPGGVPESWIPVASWTNPENRVAAMNRVVFFALNPDEVQPLQEKLQKFNRNKNVVQWFYIRK